jgi:hypothetical protein
MYMISHAGTRHVKKTYFPKLCFVHQETKMSERKRCAGRAQLNVGIDLSIHWANPRRVAV